MLRVISSSPGELEPVFEAMLENAVRICRANFGVLYLREGDALRRMAMHNPPPAYVEEHRRNPLIRPSAASGLGRLIATKRVVNIADLSADQAYRDGAPTTVLLVEAAGARSYLGVPMLKDDELIGTIIIYRQEVRPFTDKQIELVQNFAAQAVIAIENARLLQELRESLDRQTATAEILQVINRSPGNLAPVFDAMVERAMRLCEAAYGHVFVYGGELFHLVAAHGEARYVDWIRESGPRPPASSLTFGRIVAGEPLVHIGDIAEDEPYRTGNPRARTIVDEHGIHTLLSVALRKENKLLGTIVLYRQEARPFSDKQIMLVQNFAAQAVVAMENARLLNELRESLDNLRTAQDRLVQTEKLASLGQLTAGIAHEIKNPLNFVNNFSAVSVELIDELREALGGAQLDAKLRAEIGEIADMLQGNLDKVVQHGKRADAIVKNMLLHSRQGSGERRPVDVNALVEESLNLAYHGARAEKQGFEITLERSFDPAAGEVDLFPQEITRVLLNVISNGFYAATKRKAEANRGNYEPTLAAATKNLGNSVEISIRDNGTGMLPDVKEKLFSPFFTTKPAGEGTGLGLSISHDIIVKQHGGSIEVDTQPGEFTEFRIVLPRTGPSLIKSGGHATH